MVTPLLRKLREQGGTLYTFSSASKDLMKVFMDNSSYDFQFCNFACLNLPTFTTMNKNVSSDENGETTQTPDTSKKMMYMGWDGYVIDNNSTNASGDGSENTGGGTVGDQNYKSFDVIIAEHFQNYVLNFETLLWNRNGYDFSEMRTPAERVFVNWLEKVGGISFYADGTNADNQYIFREKTDNTNNMDNRTVVYLGNIDVSNVVDIGGDTFGEVYLYIPGNHGSSSDVKFRDFRDINYRYDYYTVDGEDSEYIIGRSKMLNSTTGEVSGDKTDNIYGLTLKAMYDKDAGGNAYSGTYGYTIDFREGEYASGMGLNAMNSGTSAGEFEFNCILIYYKLVDKNQQTQVTNLYGVLFLDNVSTTYVGDDGEYGDIQRYPKFKSDNISGNAFALKLDLKVDTMPISSMSRKQVNCSEVEQGTGYDTDDTIYDDPNTTVSMHLYEKALKQLQECVDIFHRQQSEIYSLQDRVSELESRLWDVDSMSDIKLDIEYINNRLDGNGLVDTQTLLDLITKNSQEISKLVTDKTLPASVQINTDVIDTDDDDIVIWKDPLREKIILYNGLKTYKVGKFTFKKNTDSGDEEQVVDNSNRITPSTLKNVGNLNSQLNKFTNLSVLYLDKPEETEEKNNNDIELCIDDTITSWEMGQSYKIIIDGDLNYETDTNNNFVIKTGIVGKTDSKMIYTQKIKIPISEVLSIDNKSSREIELICLDNDFMTDEDISTDNDTITDVSKKFIYTIK